jgi:hypothetical protein
MKVLAFFLEFVGSKFVKKRLQGATKLSSWGSDGIVSVVRCEQRIFGIYVVFPASICIVSAKMPFPSITTKEALEAQVLLQ